MNSHTPDQKTPTANAELRAPTGVVCSDLVRRLERHIEMMAPHQKGREQGKLLIEATLEIRRLENALTTGLPPNAAGERRGEKP